MRVPFRWLKEYVDIPYSPHELAKQLTGVGVKVELVEPASSGISKVFVGEIISLEKHSNADKLSVTQVIFDKNSPPIQIVTGAANIKKGDRIPVARAGAVLAEGKKIENTKLRGEPSFGMMCSAKELGIDGRSLPPEQQTGVMILSEDIDIGIDFAEYLGLNDYILHFEIFANRPDLLGIIGIARETAALLKVPLKMPKPDESSYTCEQPGIKLEAQTLCPYYTGRIIEGVQVKPSPLWLSMRLQHAGVRSINNIVDITNYVMIELGQPLHAFDLDRLSNNLIVIRQAKNGEKILTIDNEEKTMEPWMLVIADSSKPIAIAGVMGGKNSEITEKTTRVLLESASFEPGTVRRTSLTLGLRSESSRRFEKGLDLLNADSASDRATCLMKNISAAPSFSASSIARAGIRPAAPVNILFRPKRAVQILGKELSEQTCRTILENLNFKVESNTTPQWNVTVPAFRKDISEEIDLIEEITRHIGYDNIQETLPQGETLLGQRHVTLLREKRVKSFLSRLGLQEVITYGVENPEYLKICRTDTASIPITNPLSEEQGALRSSLLPGMLKVCRHNQHIKIRDLSIFEIGKIFHQDKGKKVETNSLDILLTGSPWGMPVTFFDLKGILEQLIKFLNLHNIRFNSISQFPFIEGHSAGLFLNSEKIGQGGLIEEEILERFEVAGPVFIGTLNLDILFSLYTGKTIFRPLPRYPEVTRDIAILAPKEILSDTLQEIMTDAGGNLLKEIRFFDNYVGSQTPEGKKSLAYSLIYQADDKTLTDEEVNTKHSIIKETLKKWASKEGLDLTFRE